ncbi:DUF1360 domain-containing protein [Halobacillus yeomjeoni]|uniref:DUF1360 domain-containing protein n=1 Tax=Halobacillus yeomjeoni TaxID=311194 RepID=UPI001CD47103|nr:DUF1360 domain-containing protein [Halobacillus yeomjeoni]MCA0983782.1 DUF1360 domain-containing protein [Halobacillus yeomjeoni]
MPTITWLELLILGLASFRFTRLIVKDLIMEWLRKPFIKTKVELNDKGEQEQWLEPTGWIGEGLSCHWCVGVWSAGIMIFLYIFVPFGSLLVLLLAVAGLQSLLFGGSDRYL